MNLESEIKYLEQLLMELSYHEKRGLDTSSLRIFIKSVKTYVKLNEIQSNRFAKTLTFEDKLGVIRSFLEDKKIFPRIIDVIDFINMELGLDFRDQKESRATTIRRLLNRITETPEIKDKLRYAVINLRERRVNSSHRGKSKKDLHTYESFEKWARILQNI